MAVKSFLKQTVAWVPKNNNTKDLTPDQQTVEDLAVALKPMPPTAVIDEDYMNTLKRAAAFLGVYEDDGESACEQPEKLKNVTTDIKYTIDHQSYVVSKYSGYFAKKLNPINGDSVADQLITNELEGIPLLGVTVNGKPVNAANAQDLINNRTANAAQAADQKSIDRYKYTGADPQTATNTVNNIKKTTSVIVSELQKIKNKQTNTTGNFQFSSVDLALAKNNSVNSILSFFTDSEFIRQQKLKDAQSTKNFELQQPKPLFLMDYLVADKKSIAKILFWEKVQNAAGYIIKRFDLFTGEEHQFTIFDEDIDAYLERAKIYVAFGIRMHDIHDSNFAAFIDETIPHDRWYIYKITAFQVYSDSKISSFSVDSYPISLTNDVKNGILNDINTNQSNIYELLSERFLGDKQFDWVLAGINTRNSISNRQDLSVSRGFSFVNAKTSFILEQIDKGNFVVPKSIEDIVHNVKKGLKLYGVTQTIQELLRETGILYFFDGIDPDNDGHFDQVDVSDVLTSKFFGVLSASIDPETFTVNLKNFVVNLKNISNLNLNIKPNINISPNLKPTPLEKTVDDNSPFLELGDLNKNVDLTTIEGIGIFLNAIRITANLK